MFRYDKGLSTRNTTRKRRTPRFSIRDTVANQIRKLNKQKWYVVEESKEPEGEKTYIVVYLSTTNSGSGSGKVFKGTYKDCVIMSEKLNKAKGKEFK